MYWLAIYYKDILLLFIVYSSVKCAINKAQYYAERVEQAMKGLRFDDETIIRIVITRCEIDLGHIKDEYLKIYHKTLYHAIQMGTSGDYRNAMLALMGEPWVVALHLLNSPPS